MRWLGVGLPLLLGLALVGAFVYFLVGFREPAGVAAPSVAPPAKKAPPEMPKATPEPSLEVFQRPPLPPSGRGLARWKIEHLPEGWDPVIAERLARLFETMAVYKPTDAEVIDAIYRAREEIEKYLAGLGPEAIPTLNAILGAEPDFANRRFLLYALGNLGPRSEEATFALRDFYEKNRDIIDARNEMSHLIEAMGNLKNETSFQYMNEQIDDSSTPDSFRDKFIQALGKHPQAGKSVKKFVEYMDYEEDAQIRNHSAQALGGIRDSASLDYLVDRYGREPFTPVQQTILGSIGKIGDEKALPFLEGQARTAEKDDLRFSAARAIWRIGTSKAMEVFQSVIEGERVERLRNLMKEWLQETRSPSPSPSAPNRR